MSCRTAYLISSALVLIFSRSMIWYLWNATVRAAMLSAFPTSFIDRPDVSSFSTSRCRAVSSWPLAAGASRG